MLLEVKNGCFAYGRQEILKDINIKVDKNDVFAVLGRNGAGKTTLLRCIMNMLPFKSGGAFLGGIDIRNIPPKKLWQKIAYVPQAKRGSDISVRDMIVMGRSPHIGVFGKPKEEDYAVADEIIDRMYIKKIRDKSCDCISGGELQMVLIARAVAAKPDIMIMDEPESNLDYHNQMHILNLISELSKHTACIINTHYPEHALRFANRSLLLFEDGRGISGDTQDIITEKNLEDAFGIHVLIGDQVIDDETYKYIIPRHHV